MRETPRNHSEALAKMALHSGTNSRHPEEARPKRGEGKGRKQEGGREGEKSEMPNAAEGGWHQTRAAQAQPDTQEGSTKYSIGRAGGRAGRAEAEARHGHTPNPTVGHSELFKRGGNVLKA